MKSVRKTTYPSKKVSRELYLKIVNCFLTSEDNRISVISDKLNVSKATVGRVIDYHFEKKSKDSQNVLHNKE